MKKRYFIPNNELYQNVLKDDSTMCCIGILELVSTRANSNIVLVKQNIPITGDCEFYVNLDYLIEVELSDFGTFKIKK